MKAESWKGLDIALLVAASALAAAWLIPADDADSDALVACSVFASLVVGAMVLRYRRSHDLLDPLILFSFSLLWYFGAHTLWLLANPDVIARSLYKPFVGGIAPALLLLSAGYVALLVGFWAIKDAPQRRTQVRYNYSPQVLSIVFGFGLLMQVFLLLAGGASKGQNSTQVASGVLTFRTLSYTAIVAFVVCCVQYQQNRDPSSRRLMWAMLAIQVAAGLATAQKTLVFAAIFVFVVAYNQANRRVSWRTVLTVGVLGVFLITPLVQSGRIAPTERGPNGQASLSNTTVTAGSLPRNVADFATGLPGSALEGFDILNLRTNGTESLALAYEYTPGFNDYQLGRTWPGLVATLIPSDLWPGKPTSNAARDFSINYAGQSTAGGAGLTVAVTLPGDFFLNFGWPGLLVGMLLVGAGLKLLVNAVRSLDTAQGAAVYVAVMASAVLVELTLPNMGSAIILQLAATWATFQMLTFTAKRVAPRLGVPALKGDLPAAEALT